MRNAKYIVLEGTEGCGKSTYTRMLVEHLRSSGKKVLETKEPGTPLNDLTMHLRGIMLDKQYDSQLTVTSRELVSQAIRSIHIEKVILPALAHNDYIIQDRGILSGLAYGEACGNQEWFLDMLMQQVASPLCHNYKDLYDLVVYLKSDASQGLARAQQAKQEFAAGDAIEARGSTFMQKVARNMESMIIGFRHCTVEVGPKNIDETFKDILKHIV